MNIGAKLRAARTAAGLTQEKAAEALGVSRQTVSNWENGKTYPDIVSVVKMSDLFAISLDRLLKEEAPMTDYLNYLQESTDTVQSRRRMLGILLIAIYLAVWALGLIVFWFFTSGSDAMGYSILFLWIVLPVLTLVLSLLIGANGLMPRLHTPVVLFFGAMYMLAEYATFSAANMAVNHRMLAPEWGMLAAGAGISVLGLLIGRGIRGLLRRKNKAKNQSGEN